MRLIPSDGLARGEREGPDEQGKVAIVVSKVGLGKRGESCSFPTVSVATLGFPLLLGGDTKRW